MKVELIKWITYSQDDEYPEWARIVGITNNGELYFAAPSQKHEDVYRDICDLEMAYHDDNGHYYFPEAFYRRILPQHNDKIDDLIRSLRDNGSFEFTDSMIIESGLMQ